MGVFPAARSVPFLLTQFCLLIRHNSKVHIPDVFHHLMTDEDSPIIDFYPETFEIDMNGKKMIWQGVALLPFIDEHRLLEAMAGPYKKLTEDQIRRNDWGKDAVFVGPGHALYPEFEALYGKRAGKDVSMQCIMCFMWSH
jgi:5'-3' exoribonuclease 2